MKRFGIPILASILIIGGCPPTFALGTESSSGANTEVEAAEAISPYYAQRLQWTDCGDGFQCAKVAAPLDWAKPKGKRIQLAINRHSAVTPTKNDLFVNPGGPGGSGIGFAQGFVSSSSFQNLTNNFNVVGFDPRGVGASTQVNCTGNALSDTGVVPAPDAVRGSTEWILQQRTAQRALAQACYEHTGELLAHVDTVSAARDLDVLRAVLGEEKLNYYGASYGTHLGAVYAGLFPSKVGKFVLDGAVDPALSARQSNFNQAKGFESAFNAYLAECLTRSTCPFAGYTNSEAQKITRNYLEAFDASPATTPSGQTVNADGLLTALLTPLYNRGSWPMLDALFRTVSQGDLSVLDQLLDAYWSGGANMAAANHAINCADYPADARPAVMKQDRAELEAAAPIFGTYFAYGALSCSEWLFPSHVVRAPISAKGAPTIVVIGTTNDPATPYEQAVSLANQLDSSRLITYRGEGHTAYRETSCVSLPVDKFLVNGTIPRDGLTC